MGTSDIAHKDATAALLALQSQLPHVGKDRTADTGKYQYQYADLGTVQDALFPLLQTHGLVWLTSPTLTPLGFALHYELRHESGTSIEGDYHLPQTDPQQIGSAITYARRYALCAVTGLAPGGDDDDGAAAGKPPAAEESASRDMLVQEWSEALTNAESMAALQNVWENAGRAGVASDPKVTKAKDDRKKALA